MKGIFNFLKKKDKEEKSPIKRIKLKKYLEYRIKKKVSNKNFDYAIREYNNFKMPISKRIETIDSSSKEFVKFMKFYLKNIDNDKR